jgi:hypothetical protein
MSEITFMKKILMPTILFLIALFLVLTFSSKPMQHQSATLPAITQVSADAWAKLSQKRILFGHASVGENMVEGIQDLQQEHPEIELNVIKSETPWNVKTPGFIHFYWFDLDLWKNSPNTSQITIQKVDVFSTLMETKVGEQMDVAIAKFCWADIKPDTDVSQVFSHYKAAMSKLMQDFPETTFVQVTTPLVAEPSGSVAFKNWIKQLIGKPPFRLSDNVKINQLNELIRSEYAGKAPIFDLAEIESTFPDGRRQTFSQDGKEYFSLVPDYTGDMGHLNETGRKIVADKLLVFLANLVK